MRKPGAAPPSPCTDPEALVESWRAGLMSLDLRRPPAHGMRPGDWPAIHAAMLTFVETWGLAAAVAGWTTLELFGVHVGRGVIRVDSTGVLIGSNPVRVVALDPCVIRLASGNAGRGMTNSQESVPIWAVPPGAGGAYR